MGFFIENIAGSEVNSELNCMYSMNFSYSKCVDFYRVGLKTRPLCFCLGVWLYFIEIDFTCAGFGVAD